VVLDGVADADEEELAEQLEALEEKKKKGKKSRS
jgi:hypothetical protein